MIEEATETPTPTPPVEYTVIAGLRYDTETGECYGPDQAEPFRVTDEASADWVLEKMVDADLEVKRLEQKMKALQDNLGAQLKKAKARQVGLLRRFESELEEYYRANPPQKGKTLQLTFGKLSMKTIPGGLRVKDQSLAIQWAALLGFHDAVKLTEEFRITGLPPEAKETITAALTDPNWLLSEAGKLHAEHPAIPVVDSVFEITPDEERFSVKVGA